MERELGPGKLDQRARQYFILGTSLAMLFEITVAGDFLRALQRLLDEWEYFCEKGAKGMVSPSKESCITGKGLTCKQKSLFKTQKTKRDKGEILEAESYLVFINLVSSRSLISAKNEAYVVAIHARFLRCPRYDMLGHTGYLQEGDGDVVTQR